MTDLRRENLAWPDEKRVYLTLDYECDYGTALSENTYYALSHTDELVTLLENHEIPLTCFVQTEVLDERPDEVETLRNSDTLVNFHPHSHTHAPREEISIEDEIELSTARYRTFFETDPSGYRFPNGNVREPDYRLLADYGYKFDASVFPSWRPGHFNNTRAETRPVYLPEYDIVELPFTVFSKALRIPTALSYCQLIGRPYTELLKRRGPSSVVLNIHMHDLVTPPSYDDLSPLYRRIYDRNPSGFDTLRHLVEGLLQRGYAFSTLNRLHTEIV
ncbi:polysaccharide deacetylase family protein [Halorubrum coriense]|uniref:polysaccharide deacetylase family protein n=1 Tax=Halorubrum coriense TaxID=64713 RepID=UPI0009B59F3B|nr:polysaccharide deacetylase family protein [Halorubrum coriense]